MPERVYTIDEIGALVVPVAQAYGVKRVALFGSYAKGDATPESDIDLHIDKGNIKGFFELSRFHLELQERLGAEVDVLTTGALSKEFLNRIKGEEVILYES